ncbi:MAG: dTDP-glucose 4,6-dehydratase [Deinococcus sp.]|nr:dTDP-glucose 4,6-dehydratase [Deinococcus sp.]
MSELAWRSILVTGGCGFIGSNFIRYMLGRYQNLQVVNLDKLTYCGNLANLVDLSGDPRYIFVQGDIARPEDVKRALKLGPAEVVVNFAAETHVDRALLSPGVFVQTDVFGTYTLLEAARQCGVKRYLQVSSDEVYGPVLTGRAREEDPLRPHNPYAASKAGAELLTQAYYASFGFPTLITRGANTIGPYQYPEKIVPLFITNALDDLPLPVYGNGGAVRDYLYVTDHCRAVDLVLQRGEPGEIYNVGTGQEITGIQVAQAILELLDKPPSLLRFVQDRPGHDRRYAVDASKLRGLGWEPVYGFQEALAQTVQWYVANEPWWRPLKSGEFQAYYLQQYGERLRQALLNTGAGGGQRLG